MTRVRPYQLRRGPEGNVEVRIVGVDSILAREDDGSFSVYEPQDFAERFPLVTRRSMLERRESLDAG